VADERLSTSVWMKLTALLALNFVLAREVPVVLTVPVLLFLLAALDVVVVRVVILARPLAVRHAVFLAAGAVLFAGYTVWLTMAQGRGSPGVPTNVLRRVARGYVALTGFPGTGAFTVTRSEALDLAGRGLASAGLLLAAWSVGLVVEQALKRRSPAQGRGDDLVVDLVAVTQGVVVGFGLSAVVVTVEHALHIEFPDDESLWWYVHWGAVSTGPILGGLAGRAARRPGRDPLGNAPQAPGSGIQSKE
jgi:hypothetical protein